MPRSPEEASADLGADAITTFRRVTLPAVWTSLLSGGLLAFGLSFDEIIVTVFTAGAGTQTLPMWIYSAIQRPNELPVVNVVALDPDHRQHRARVHRRRASVAMLPAPDAAGAASRLPPGEVTSNWAQLMFASIG